MINYNINIYDLGSNEFRVQAGLKYESKNECKTVQDKGKRQVSREVWNKQVPFTQTENRAETFCKTVTKQQCTTVSKTTCKYH